MMSRLYSVVMSTTIDTSVVTVTKMITMITAVAIVMAVIFIIIKTIATVTVVLTFIPPWILSGKCMTRATVTNIVANWYYQHYHNCVDCRHCHYWCFYERARKFVVAASCSVDSVSFSTSAGCTMADTCFSTLSCTDRKGSVYPTYELRSTLLVDQKDMDPIYGL